MKLSPTLHVVCGFLVLFSPLVAEEDKQPVPDQAPVIAKEDQIFPDGDADPFAMSEKMPGIPEDRSRALRQALRLRLETWEAPAVEVAKRLDSLQSAPELEKFRSECLDGIEGIRLVNSPVLGLDLSTRAEANSTTERIYPTEYEPPVFPGSVEVPKKDKVKTWKDVLETKVGEATPTSFETRLVGQTFEAVCQPVAVEEGSWDLSLSFEDTGFHGVETLGADVLEITMPVISTFRTGGMVRLKQSKWRLLSVMEPPRGLDGKPSDKRWVTLVRIDPEG